MPAAVPVSRRERLVALAAVAVIQALLAIALITGLRVGTVGHHEIVKRLVDVDLAPPPPPIPPPQPHPVRKQQAASAPKAEPKPIGGSPGPSHATAAPRPIVAIKASAPASGGGTGTGPAMGSGAGGGTGDDGFGSGDGGGADLVQIAGAILPSDYPRDLREQRIGGRVRMVFTVGPRGLVISCRITRSSGVPELDELTCRLIRQRFRYRPSTDRYGRPIADEVEGEHDWIPARE
jgi:protein TonB